VPCSPNKILVSQVTALRPNSSALPIGFSTSANAGAITLEADERLAPYTGDEPFVVPVEFVVNLLDLLASAIEPDAGRDWDVDAFKGSILYLSNEATEGEKGEVLMLVRRSRNFSKRRPGGRLQDYPATQSDELKLDQGHSRPRLLLNRQNAEAPGWNGVAFWWPMLFVPPSTRPVIFAHRKST
jgi:hypothetical protein